jgi:integrase
MQLKRRGNGYYYIYFDRQRQKSLKTKDLVCAVKLLEMEEQVERKAQVYELGKVARIKISELHAEYLRHRAISDVSSGTIKNDDLAFKKFIEYNGDLLARSVKRETIDTYKTELLSKGLTREYINTLLRPMLTAFGYALDKGYIDKNPFLKRRGEKWNLTFRTDDEVPRYLSMSEIKALLGKIEDPDYRVVINFFLYTGLRRAEVARLQVTDIDLENNLIIVRKTKSKRGRTVPIHEDLRPMLRQFIRGDIGPLFPRWRSADTYTTMFVELAKSAHVDARLHDLRHTFASYLAMADTDLKRIKDLLGHSDMKTTERYAKVKTEHLRQSVNKLKFGGGQG